MTDASPTIAAEGASLASRSSVAREIDVLIVGSGFSGLGMGVALKREGKRSFVILEKADSLGGTWRDNTYPGCACDIASHLYSFSFAPNPTWSRMYPTQPEIRAYLERVADRFGLRQHLILSTPFQAAYWDEADRRWLVEAADGRRWRAKALVSGMGGLHKPLLPDLPGLETFAGPSFHSAQWAHDVSLEGKTVGVIGSGASAIQFVPEIRKTAGKVVVFQRTPPWIMPKRDRPIGAGERALFKIAPFTQNWMRRAIYARCEFAALGFLSARMKLGEKMALAHLAAQVSDPLLRAKLTPNYTMGCKRVLVSNDWYPALQKSNVRLESKAIARIEPDAVITTDDTRHPLDVLIYATGFKAMDVLNPAVIVGRGGHVLNDAWRKHAEAFFGITVSGYPNLFLLMGPNTGLGHNSMVFMIESQIRHAMSALKAMDRAGGAALDVRKPVQNAFNAELDERMQKTVWKSGCSSWYLTDDGKAGAIWPGYTFEYRNRTAKVDLRDYDLV